MPNYLFSLAVPVASILDIVRNKNPSPEGTSYIVPQFLPRPALTAPWRLRSREMGSKKWGGQVCFWFLI